MTSRNFLCSFKAYCDQKIDRFILKQDCDRRLLVLRIRPLNKPRSVLALWLWVDQGLDWIVGSQKGDDEKRTKFDVVIKNKKIRQ